jgi:hypothetical protein
MRGKLFCCQGMCYFFSQAGKYDGTNDFINVCGDVTVGVQVIGKECEVYVLFYVSRIRGVIMPYAVIDKRIV